MLKNKMMLKNRSGSNLLKVFNKHVGWCTWGAASSSSVPSECSTYFKVLAYLCIISPMMHLLVLTYLPCIPDHCASPTETASQNTYDGPPLSLQLWLCALSVHSSCKSSLGVCGHYLLTCQHQMLCAKHFALETANSLLFALF